MLGEILAAIRAANLPAPVYRTAREILDRTGSNGYARLTYDEALAIVQTEKPETLRGHLAQLQRAGLLTYRRNAAVHVMWHPQTARVDIHGARLDIQNAREDCADGESGSSNLYTQANNLYTQPRAARGVRTLPVGKVTTGTTGKVGISLPTYLPVVEGVQGETLTDQERSLALLTDPAVGVTGELLKIVALYPFEQIRLQVFQALRQMAEKRVKSIGVIRHRLEVSAAATVTDADRASDLWLRHETEDEAHAERRRKYCPPEYADIIIGGEEINL